MNKLYRTHCNNLNNLFISQYLSEYKLLKYKDKSKILGLVSSSYRKWFYSSLIDETILTPYTLSTKLNSDFDIKTYTMPTLRISKNPTNKGVEINFINIEYSLENHPVVKDLFTLLDFCIPNITLTEHDLLHTNDADAIALKLSIQDIFYVEYLFNVAIQLKLLKKMTSIYSNHAQPSHNVDSFFKENHREILDKIVDASLDMLSYQISSVLPDQIMIFDKEYFISILKDPISVDEIFANIYDSLGIDIDSMISAIDEEESILDLTSDEFGEALISSTYLLSLIIDKYFLTPIGYYLKLIAPIYYNPIDFKEELLFIYESLAMTSDINSVAWSHCSDFYLTTLGLNYFGVRRNKNNFIALPNSISFSELLMQIEDSIQKQKHMPLQRNSKKPSNIIEIKFCLMENKKLWFNIQMHEAFTLHDIHIQICSMFLINYDTKYSICIGEQDSPFFKYVSPLYKNKFKKTDNITLKDLELEKKQLLTYTIPRLFSSPLSDFQKIQITLEIIDVKQANPRIHYPNITKKGKAFERWEHNI